MTFTTSIFRLPANHVWSATNIAFRWYRRFATIGLSFFIIIRLLCYAPTHAQNSDSSFRIYSVGVVRTPFQSGVPLVGSGIYLGRNVIITAAHVVEPNLQVLLAGQTLPATVVRLGSFEAIDLAILSVDQTRIPVWLQLRRNPICTHEPKAGEIAVVIASSGAARSRIVEFNGSSTYVDISTPGDSGSGVFSVQKGCLLGILNSRISDFFYLFQGGHMVRDLGMGSTEIAKHFVPARDIINFVPPALRFLTEQDK